MLLLGSGGRPPFGVAFSESPECAAIGLMISVRLRFTGYPLPADEVLLEVHLVGRGHSRRAPGREQVRELLAPPVRDQEDPGK